MTWTTASTCRFDLAYHRLISLLLLLAASVVAGNEDNFQVRQDLWQRFSEQLSNASPEQERLLRERAQVLGQEYFPGVHDHGDELKEGTSNNRNLRRRPPPALNLTAPTRSCGEVVSTLSIADLKFISSAFVKAVLPAASPLGAFAPVALQFLSSTIKYPIQVQKICTSCREIESLYKGEAFLKEDSAYGFGKYCGQGRFGYNVRTSGLLLLPLDATTGKVLSKKVLRSAIFTRGTTPGSQRSPSGVFPSNITAAFQAAGDAALSLVSSLLNIIPALFGASAGAVAVLPDNIGYGESYTHPKSYLVYSLYQQASVSLWLKARRLLLSTSTTSTSCTTLEPVVSVSGYSEGGYAAFSTCLALNKLSVGKSKIRVLRCQCGGTPFDVDYVTSYTFAQLKNNSGHVNAPALPIFLGNAYSSTNPDLANSNRGQDALKAAYKKVAPTWLDSPSFQVLIGLSSAVGPLNTVYPSFLDLYLQDLINLAPSRSCSGPGLHRKDTRFLCQAIVDNILVKPLLSANFPTVVCHAQDDRLVPYNNIPNFSSNQNVKFYQPSLPQLTPTGNHQGGNLFCAFGAILAFSIPSNASDAPQMMSELTDTSVCKQDVVALPKSTKNPTDGGPKHQRRRSNKKSR